MAGEKEIGLIQLRTGKQRNLPKALELGEMALTTDEARVFVGIPSTVIPASLVSGRTNESVPGSGQENVEIITEFTPVHVINRTIYKPIRFDVPASTWLDLNFQPTTDYRSEETIINPVGEYILRVPTADRLFIDYVAFTLGANKILESGTISVVIIDGNVMVQQVNNTTDADGLVWIQAGSEKIGRGPSVNGAMTNIIIQNLRNEKFRVEYIYRGWNEPL